MESAVAGQQGVAEAGREQRLATVRSHMDALETNARTRLLKVLEHSRLRLIKLDKALGSVSREKWTIRAIAGRVERLRTQAERLGGRAMDRVDDVPARAVAMLADGARVPLQGLTKEVDRLLGLLDADDGAGARQAESPSTEPDGKAEPEGVGGSVTMVR